MFWPFLDFAFVVSVVLPRESVDEMFFVLSVGISVQGHCPQQLRVHRRLHFRESFRPSHQGFCRVELRADVFSKSSILCERIVLLECVFEMACCSSGLAGAVHGDGHLHDSISVHSFCEKEAGV